MSPDRLSLCIGSGAAHLAGRLRCAAFLDILRVERREFPDGEIRVRVPGSLDGHAVAVLQGTGPPQHRNLEELYQLVDVATHGGAREVACVVPYLAYARQDRRTAPGEPASLAIVGRTLRMLGASTLATVDAHGPAGLLGLPLQTASIDPTDLVVAHVRGVIEARGREVAVIAPDAGRIERARRVAERAGGRCLALSKRKARDGRTWYDEPPSEQAWSGHAVAIDDVCSSGSTLLPLAAHLARLGFTSMDFLVTHLLADAGALERSSPLPMTIVASNTLPNPCARLDVAPLIVEWLLVLARRRGTRG